MSDHYLVPNVDPVRGFPEDVIPVPAERCACGDSPAHLIFDMSDSRMPFKPVAMLYREPPVDPASLIDCAGCE